MEEVNLNELIKKVYGLKNNPDEMAQKTFRDFIIKFQDVGCLKDGLLDLTKIDGDEREELYRLVEKFDRNLFDVLVQSSN